MAGFIYQHIVSHQLAVVLVRRHHVCQYAALAGLQGYGADYVVSLIAGHLQYRDIVRAQDILYHRHAEAYVLRRLLALCLILGIDLMAEGAALGVEGHGYVGGLLLVQYLLQRVDEAEDGGGVLFF